MAEVRVARPPLRAIPGPNRTVNPCRDAIEVAAEKFGAQKVEAVSAGPHSLDDEGYLVAPVHMRVTYAPPTASYEVREAILTCIVDSTGQLVDAFDPADEASRMVVARR